MVSRVPGVLSPADLPAAELWAARLDGELFPIADGFGPIDLPECPASRAASLAPLMSARLIVELNTAAWVFGACDLPPTAHQFCCTADARAKPVILRGLSVREVVLDDDELVVVGGIRVTSPLRTACDLVRSTTDFDRASQLVVARLLELDGSTVADCIQLLSRRRNLPGKRLTLRRLQQIQTPAQPLLTR